MESPKKSRKWYLRKVNEMAGHSSKYQKDYQNKQNTAHKSNINTHRATYTHRYTAHSTYTYTTAMHTYVHTAQQYATLLPDQQVCHTSVTPGGHSVRHTEVVPTLNTELTYHSYGGAHGSEPIPTVFHISKYNKKRCDCGDDRHSSNTFSTLDTNSKGSTKIRCYT